MRSWIAAAALVLAASATGCAPAIGDSCASAIDCSLTGDRVCDTSTPNGECTIFGCETGTCPGEAVCVRFRPDDARLAFTACMRRCEARGHCRVDEGYDCVAAEDITDPTDEDVVLAELTEGEDASSFCISTDPMTE